MPFKIGTKVCQVFLVAVNILFLLCGLAVLGVGVYIQLKENDNHYSTIFQDAPCAEHNCGKLSEVLRVPYVLMALGGFMTLLSLLGCCGAFCENHCFLCIYALLLILTLSAELVAAVLIAIFRKKINLCLHCSMEHQVLTLYNNTNFVAGIEFMKRDHNKTTLITKAWDVMQVKFKCCGAGGPEDYDSSVWRNQTLKSATPKFVPPTCCMLTNSDPEYPNPVNRQQCQAQASLYVKSKKEQQQKSPTAVYTTVVYTTGCYEKFSSWLRANLYLIIVPIMSIIIQLLGCIAACLLMSHYRKQFHKHMEEMEMYVDESEESEKLNSMRRD